MRIARIGAARAAAVLLMVLSASTRAQAPPLAAALEAIVPSGAPQQMLELPVRVVDAAGQGVPHVKVRPWALRSSQGHGLWSQNDERAKVAPATVTTDAEGEARVLYPCFRDLEERIRTTSVSLSVDHPNFAFDDELHIDVPLETEGPRVVTLKVGVALEVRPSIDGAAAPLDNLFALWSDGRSWQPGTAAEKTANGALRIPAMPPGDNSVLLVRLEGERATHFSRITDFTLTAGETKSIDVPLVPAVRIRGTIGDNVPRPVRSGRVKVWTLPQNDASSLRVSWFTWAPMESDGTFTIDAWPPEERIQVLALCDDFVASSGRLPPGMVDRFAGRKDPYHRPQVFGPDFDERIELAMEPMGRCVVKAVDEDEAPVAGVTVVSWPNVGWWEVGSQIYCAPLVRGERLLRERDYLAAVDKDFADPFEVVTGADGTATLTVPEGDERLAVMSDVYELPVFLGQRFVRIELKKGETIEQVLRLQPRGTEKLGEWDKLAGVVFGCSTREGRRICALPGVQKKMDEFAERFRDGKNQRDPKLLAEAYTLVADAFLGVGDQAEADRWRQKAAAEAAKIQTDAPPAN